MPTCRISRLLLMEEDGEVGVAGEEINIGADDKLVTKMERRLADLLSSPAASIGAAATPSSVANPATELEEGDFVVRGNAGRRDKAERTRRDASRDGRQWEPYISSVPKYCVNLATSWEICPARGDAWALPARPTPQGRQ